MSVSTEDTDASERFLFTEGGRGKAGWFPHSTGSDDPGPDPGLDPSLDADADAEADDDAEADPDPDADAGGANDDDDASDAFPAFPLPEAIIPPERGEESDIVPRERVTAVGEGAEGVWEETTRVERWV